MNEHEAIAQLKNGDVRGLEVLVRKFQLDGVRIALSVIQDLGTAEEIVQEAFIRVYQRIEQFDETRSFRSWFLRIVVNDSLKVVAQQKRMVPLEKVVPREESGTGGNEHSEDLSFEQDEFSIAHEDADLLREVLKSLSPEHSTVLYLKYYLEMADEEIGEIVDVPTGTVKSRLHAAKRQVRCLLQWCDETVSA